MERNGTERNASSIVVAIVTKSAFMADSTKFAPDDWKTGNFLVSSSAERQRAAAHNIRQENHKISNNTGKKCKSMSLNRCAYFCRECDSMDAAQYRYLTEGSCW